MTSEFEDNKCISDLSDHSKDVLMDFYEKMSKIHSESMKIGTIGIIDKYPVFGENLGQVKGKVDKQIALLKECKDLRSDILGLCCELEHLCGSIEDVSIGLVNSFETNYDCDMFVKGGMYQSKFLYGSNHWSCAHAKEEWREQYDKCVEFFKEITSGLTTHNFKILYMEDGSKAYFGFTVHGVPGDFEISFPLNSSGYHIERHWLDTDALPMQMRLTWRRRWTIPVYDYFFDGFGSYEVSDVNERLRSFVSNQEYMKFCENSPGLEEEIQKSSKEGKKVI